MVRGRGVHTAGRIAEAASGDEILVSTEILGPLDGRYRRREPCLVSRGLAEAVPTVRIEWRSPGP